MSAIRLYAAVSAAALVIGVPGIAFAAEEPGCGPERVLDLAPTDPSLRGDLACSRPALLCPDFPTQANAQAALDVSGADPDLLDPDHDGIACEQYFGTEGRQVAVVPLGGPR
jgi:hypothetical protein